jgi:hypothetical protein
MRSGTGKVLKYFMDKSVGDTISSVNKEIDELTDNDLAQLVEGITNETLTYA